jgi:hypothetical protein
MKVSIKRVSMWSAAKVGCLMSALPIMCIAITAIALLVSPATVVSPSLHHQLRVFGNSATAFFFVMLYAVGVGCVSAIGWGMAAFVYNVVSMLFGGIEVSLRREDGSMRVQPTSPPPAPEPPQRKTSSPDGMNWYDLNHDEKEIIRKRRAQHGVYDVSHMRAEDGSFPTQWDKNPKNQ